MARTPRIPGETPSDEEPDLPLDAAAPRSDEEPADFALHSESEWKTKSWREAMAAGVTKAVLCADGWYVPNSAVPAAPLNNLQQRH